jgi:hypothetical protein
MANRKKADRDFSARFAFQLCRVELTTPATIATWLFTGQPAVDDGAGTADPGFHLQGFDRAVPGTGPALDAGVQVNNLCLALLDFEDPMRTNHGTHAAANAFFLVKLKGADIFQIS